VGGIESVGGGKGPVAFGSKGRSNHLKWGGTVMGGLVCVVGGGIICFAAVTPANLQEKRRGVSTT